MSSLKIMHIASGDLWAGAEVQLYTLARSQKNDTTTSVCVVLLNPGILEQKLIKANIEVIVINEAEVGTFQILRHLIHIILEQRPDVVHTHRLKENILGSIAAFIAGRRPSIRTVHGSPEYNHPWWNLRQIFLSFIDHSCGQFLQRRIIAVSEDLADRLRKRFPGNMIVVIENGIHIDETHKLLASSKLDQEGDSETDTKIGYSGRLVPVKRVDIFIHTARCVTDNYPELAAEFYIYGEGPQRAKLEGLCHELDIGGKVHFEGHVDDIYRKLQDLDTLMLTSDHEGLPMVLLEAMMLGIPVIAHAVGGIPKLLDNGSCGLLVKDNDCISYARSIHELMSSPAKRLEITRNASKRVNDHYSDNKNARAYYSEYMNIL